MTETQYAMVHWRPDKEMARANLQAMEDVYRRAVEIKCWPEMRTQ